ncbi:hypothetical protein N8996_07090 [Candidatus Poseidonia alphae]|nr:hypothetical protein [Candidatus Poseidonia alphae]
MFLKLKTIIYPLLWSNPSFTLWYDDNKIEKTYDINIIRNQYNITGSYYFKSRFCDKESIYSPCNKDIIKCDINIHHNNDIYRENICEYLIYLKNDNRPYHTDINYKLFKNDIPIKRDEIDKELFDELNRIVPII